MIENISMLLVLIVALEHVYILVLEMFLWTTPKALKVFGITKKFAESTKAMAANQGLYNGFLAAGLFWGLLHSKNSFGLHIQLFFLCCIVIAAIYGALTVKKSILLVQGAPAILAMLSVLFVTY
jgi:putative membrane protein